MTTCCMIASVFTAFGQPVEAANPLTPLMGWSSWNTFALDISEDIIVGVAQTMATNGLKEAGYVYVNIDDGANHRLTCPATQGKFVDIILEVMLEKGIHFVRLSNASSVMPDVDLMRVVRR